MLTFFQQPLGEEPSASMDRVDDMSQDIVKYNTYSRNLSKQRQQKHQYLQRRQQENAQRQSRGEPPLPEEDISKMFKPPQPPPRMDTLLIAETPSKLHQPPLLPSQELRFCFVIIYTIILKLH
ncbi:eukaryotic translation initiation factor 3 subunit H [Lates japonicus]|uniref:Eukaryotic translation initiation factor 3 subunit H n=1 Tax=Lates japonicus TaxID=270547 RepID=A0AAD3MW21_LATJO|nr:eukaryotic translation initiation factor 3 subunit H [Lates japonicus]